MDLATLPWTRVAAMRAPLVLLPLGAVEAHGPHLPLSTDTAMAVALAQRCTARLGDALVAPALTTTAASFAADFAGTIDVPAEVEQRVIMEIASSLHAHGARVVLINLHFDPEHLRAVRGAVAELDAKARGRTLFPDFTRRAHAQAIGGEFATGDCHGGAFETSLMLAVAPEMVGDYASLPGREVGLVAGMRAGKRSFRELGLDQAYCGHPAAARAKEGERLLAILEDIVVSEARSAAAPR